MEVHHLGRIKARRLAMRAPQLIRKFDAKADRKARMLQVNASHEDVPFGRATTSAVRSEIEDLASWLDLEVTGL